MGDAEALNLLGQYLGRNAGDLPDEGVAGSGIDAVSLDWDAIQNYFDTPVDDREEPTSEFFAENKDELWIALSQSYAPNQLFNNSVGVMSLIDRDTDQVLARFLNVSEDAIGRHNIDEQNVPPDRLTAEPGKAVFSHSERVTVPEGMARDPNGATDLAAIEAQIRKITEIAADGSATGNWQNWRGLGLLGTKFGSSHWFDLNDNPADGLELLITSGSTIQERIDRQLPIWGIDLDNDGLLGSNGVYGAAAAQIRDPDGLLPAYQNELLISAEAPNAVNLSVDHSVDVLIRSVKHLLTKLLGTRSTRHLFLEEQSGLGRR